MDLLAELKTKRMELVKANRALMDRAKADSGIMPAEDAEEYDRRQDEVMNLSANIERYAAQARAESLIATPEPVRSRGGGPLPLEEPSQTPAAKASPITLTYGEQLTVRDGRRTREPRQITLRANSPHMAVASNEYRENFRRYALGGHPDPQAVMQVGDDTRGGYLAPVQMSAQLIQFVDDLLFMRRISNVLPPLDRAVSLGVPSYDTDYADFDWTPEVPAADITEDTAPRFGRRNFTPHLSSKRTDISMQLLRQSMLDLEGFIAQRLAYKYAGTEETAFLTGSGSERPLGVFTASADGIPTSRDVVAAGATANGGNSQTELHGDDFVTVLYNEKEQYRSNGSWIFGRNVAREIFLLKDGLGRYIWDDTAIRTGGVATLLGRPYYVSEFAPNTLTAGLYTAIFGDFRAGYWIADSMGLEIQRLNEIGALQNRVVFLARRWTDGMPVLAEAFTRLRMAS